VSVVVYNDWSDFDVCASASPDWQAQLCMCVYLFICYQTFKHDI